MFYLGERLLTHIKLIAALIYDPKLSQSYYPLERRKSKTRIALELLLWYLRHHEVNVYYYLYGFDRCQSRPSEYLPLKEFNKIRDSRNLRPVTDRRFNYACLLQDKFIFAQFVSSLGFPTPKVFALCEGQSLLRVDADKVVSPQVLFLNEREKFDGFCKPVTTMNGRGAFPLRVSDGKLFSTEGEISIDELLQRFTRPYLIQERVQQHPAMSTLHPASTNTLRVITFNDSGNIRVFSAAQRMGTGGRSVDNWSAGGILVGVDLDTGRMRTEGLYKPGYGGMVTCHPQSGVTFAGFEVPYFSQAIEMAAKLHSYFYRVHSIGWDIAIGESGPIIIEGNDDWDGAVPMGVESNFRQRFLELYRS